MLHLCFINSKKNHEFCFLHKPPWSQAKSTRKIKQFPQHQDRKTWLPIIFSHMDSLMSHNTAVPTVYLYLQVGTNLNPISPAQKLFSQSLRSTHFESSALIVCDWNLDWRGASIWERAAHDKSHCLTRRIYRFKKNYHGSWDTQRGNENKTTQSSKNY